MGPAQVQKDTIIIKQGQPLDSLSVIINGSVKASSESGDFLLVKGDVIGLYDIAYETHSMTYTAFETASYVTYSLTDYRNTAAFLRERTDLKQLLFLAAMQLIRQVFDQYAFSQYNCDTLFQTLKDHYSTYREYCIKYHVSPKTLPGMDEIVPFSIEEPIPGWIPDYYDSIVTAGTRKMSALVDTPCLLSGFLLRASQDMRTAMAAIQDMQEYKEELSYFLLNENRLDFFDLFTDLYYRSFPKEENPTALGAIIGRLMIQVAHYSSVNSELCDARAGEYKEKVSALTAAQADSAASFLSDKAAPPILKDTLSFILTYAECEEPFVAAFTRYLHAYKEMPDKSSTDDTARKLRGAITKGFHHVYTSIFKKSLKEESLPAIIKMFLNFGYMDEDLAGTEACSFLYSCVDTLKSGSRYGIYTLYEWLLAIYEGKKEPCRNELDLDYDAYLREQRISGKITPDEERALSSDTMQKVIFELENMFPVVNKITFGRLASYCPVFAEHNVLKSLEMSLVTVDKLRDNLDLIRSMDFSAFYREVIYSNQDYNIAREYVQIEILPDFILFPNVGTRGIMWQEIEGKRRTTPSRMMLPIFQLEDLTNVLIRLTGEFRFEMCKRIQGARWNDISERSLTSEYCDYIQFYKKNTELSPDTKEKIKQSIRKSKNNYREVFVQDYIQWISYEAKGSPRLNKVARAILFTYCPFSKEYRDTLEANPIFKEMMDRYKIKIATKLHHLNAITQKISRSGAEIPKEFLDQQAFLEK